MHPNFIILLFLLAFANVANAQDNKEIKTFPELVRHATHNAKEHVSKAFRNATKHLRHATHVVAEDLDNAAHDVDKHFKQAIDRVTNIKNEANADIHKFLTKLTEKDGEKAVEMAKQESLEALKQFKKDVAEREYAGKLVVSDNDKTKIQKWLVKKEDRIESFTKVKF
jgi:NCAIR mutase (PurE)-related protein